jgi:hypothetical protein
MPIPTARLLLPVMLVLAPGLAPGQTASPPNPAPAEPVQAAADACAAERALVEAEATTPGILQRLALDGLRLCLARGGVPGR